MDTDNFLERSGGLVVPDDHLEGAGSHLKLYTGKRDFRQSMPFFEFEYRVNATRFPSHLCHAGAQLP